MTPEEVKPVSSLSRKLGVASWLRHRRAVHAARGGIVAIGPAKTNCSTPERRDTKALIPAVPHPDRRPHVINARRLDA